MTTGTLSYHRTPLDRIGFAVLDAGHRRHRLPHACARAELVDLRRHRHRARSDLSRGHWRRSPHRSERTAPPHRRGEPRAACRPPLVGRRAAGRRPRRGRADAPLPGPLRPLAARPRRPARGRRTRRRAARPAPAGARTPPARCAGARPPDRNRRRRARGLRARHSGRARYARRHGHAQAGDDRSGRPRAA